MGYECRKNNESSLRLFNCLIKAGSSIFQGPALLYKVFISQGLFIIFILFQKYFTSISYKRKFVSYKRYMDLALVYIS